MSKQRIPVGNILALSRSTERQTKDMEQAATSYMPTDIDLEKIMRDEASPEQQAVDLGAGERRKNSTSANFHDRKRPARKKATSPEGPAAKRKRISLYLDDETLTKVFRVSLERHEQLSSATHRLILEALKARGL